MKLHQAIIAISALIVVFSTVPAAAQEWGVATANSTMKRWPDGRNMDPVNGNNGWTYATGYGMYAMEKAWRATGDKKYFTYIKNFLDGRCDANGNAPNFSSITLDRFLLGYSYVMMYRETGDQRYKKVAQAVRNGFINYPRNADSGFWLVKSLPGQQWVDGVFMGMMFLVRYGSLIGDSAYAFNETVKQMTSIVNHCGKVNGLILHAYDETKSASWANKTTGLSPEVWSEGLGWYALMIADVFDFLPVNHPGRPRLIQILQDLCRGLKSVQDRNTGMWDVVVDKPDSAGNWNETSGTGMFIYLIKKAMLMGFVPAQDYQPVIDKAIAGIRNHAAVNADSTVDVRDISSLGVMNSYSAYINSSRQRNWICGVASFMIGNLIVERPNLATAVHAPANGTARQAPLFHPIMTGLRTHAVLPGFGERFFPLFTLAGKKVPSSRDVSKCGNILIGRRQEIR